MCSSNVGVFEDIRHGIVKIMVELEKLVKTSHSRLMASKNSSEATQLTKHEEREEEK